MPLRDNELPSIQRGTLDVVASAVTPRGRRTPRDGSRRNSCLAAGVAAPKEPLPGPWETDSQVQFSLGPTPPFTPTVSSQLRKTGGLGNVINVAQLLQAVVDSSIDGHEFAKAVSERADDLQWLSALGMAIREIGVLVNSGSRDSAVDRLKAVAAAAQRTAQQKQVELERANKERDALKATEASLRKELKRLRDEVEFLSLFPTSQDAAAIFEERERERERHEASKRAAAHSAAEGRGGGREGSKSPQPSRTPRSGFASPNRSPMGMRLGAIKQQAEGGAAGGAMLGSAVRKMMENKGLGEHSHLVAGGSHSARQPRTERIKVREEMRKKHEYASEMKLQLTQRSHQQAVAKMNERIATLERSHLHEFEAREQVRADEMRKASFHIAALAKRQQEATFSRERAQAIASAAVDVLAESQVEASSLRSQLEKTRLKLQLEASAEYSAAGRVAPEGITVTSEGFFAQPDGADPDAPSHLIERPGFLDSAGLAAGEGATAQPEMA